MVSAAQNHLQHLQAADFKDNKMKHGSQPADNPPPPLPAPPAAGAVPNAKKNSLTYHIGIFFY